MTLSHNFRPISMSCTNGGETRRSGYQSHSGKALCFSNRFDVWPRPRVGWERRFHRPRSSHWIPGATCCTLRICRQGADFSYETGAHYHAQAHISTQSPPPREDARVSRAHEDQERRSRVEPPPRYRPQACGCKRRLPRLALLCFLFQPECVASIPFRLEFHSAVP